MTETMNHDQAVSSQAAERYVLGELTPSEREAFEGHYFDCAACFEQVETGAQFLGRAREVLDNDREPEPGWFAGMLRDLRRPAPVFVSAMLLCAVGIGVHQQSVISDARAPRIEDRYDLVAAKGAVQSLNVSRKARLGLSVVFTPRSEFTSYRAQIVTDAGKVVYSLPMSAQVGDSVTIALPAAALDPGRYSLVVQGLTRDGVATEVGSAPFDLHLAD
jgi:Putative zinc-finger